MSSEDYPAMPEREAQRQAGLNVHLKPSSDLGNITEHKLALLCPALAGELWGPLQTAHVKVK